MRLDQPARILFAAIAAFALMAVKASDRDTAKAARAISESVYREHIASLASDEFEGRSPGTAGEQKTVEYLEEQFLEMGMQPVAGGSFRQDVALVEITASGQRLTFNKDGGSVALALGDDMVLGTRRVRDESSIADSEVVFVGYGIVAPEFGWNDYAGLDLHGKTALILVNDPGFVTGDETLFRGKAMTYHGRWTYKYEEAARQGAAAAIIIHDTAPASYDWGVVRNGWTGPQFYADRAGGNADRSALEGWITLERAHQVMELAGQDFDKLQSAAVERGFRPVPLGITATGGVRNTIRRMRSPNVVGVMPGKNRPDEYVIYVAHWDHLGVAEAEAEDRIYNGAVDNATGIAGILSIARGFRDLLPGASRSVMYMAVTAEESGLIGSEYYTENPLVPLEKTAAVINIDALYPMGRAKDVEVIGYGASGLEEMLAAAARKQGRTLTPDRKSEAGYFYRSDHFNFAKAGVPALYIKSGAVLRESGPDAGVAWQEKYVAERYHKPSDDYADSWDVTGSIEDLKLLFEVGARVANSETWPEWHEGNEFRAARDQSAAARAPADE
ncbi:MAG: M28 family metallopeptidase [Steroidobacteraceae bacterium]